LLETNTVTDVVPPKVVDSACSLPACMTDTPLVVAAMCDPSVYASPFPALPIARLLQLPLPGDHSGYFPRGINPVESTPDEQPIDLPLAVMGKSMVSDQRSTCKIGISEPEYREK
jgi:hypothetical protein